MTEPLKVALIRQWICEYFDERNPFGADTVKAFLLADHLADHLAKREREWSKTRQADLRQTLIDADSALSLIFYRKPSAIRELDDGDFYREVERLISKLRRAYVEEPR